MTKMNGKHEQLYSFADETRDPKALESDLGSWLIDVTVEIDEVL